MLIDMAIKVLEPTLKALARLHRGAILTYRNPKSRSYKRQAASITYYSTGKRRGKE